MRHVIEVVGAAGTGKSTLLDALRRRGGVSWQTVPDALRRPRPGAAGLAARSIGRVPTPLTRRLARHGFVGPSNGELQDALHDRTDWDDYLTFLLGIDLSNAPWPDQALLGLVWHTRRLQQRARIDDTTGPRVIDDKPLSLPTSLLTAVTDPSARRRHAELVPTPSAVIHLAADVDTVVDRLRRRAETDGRTIRRHRRAYGEELATQVAAELAMADEVAEVLADRGVAVTIIDATRPVTDNVDRVADVLRRIAACPW